MARKSKYAQPSTWGNLTGKGDETHALDVLKGGNGNGNGNGNGTTKITSDIKSAVEEEADNITWEDKEYKTDVSDTGIKTISWTQKGSGEGNKPIKSYEEAYASVDKTKYPTLESFKAAGEEYKAKKEVVREGSMFQVPTRGAVEIKTLPDIENVELRNIPLIPGSISGTKPKNGNGGNGGNGGDKKIIFKKKKNKGKNKGFKNIQSTNTRGKSGLASTCTGYSCPGFENKPIDEHFSNKPISEAKQKRINKRARKKAGLGSGSGQQKRHKNKIPLKIRLHRMFNK